MSIDSTFKQTYLKKKKKTKKNKTEKDEKKAERENKDGEKQVLEVQQMCPRAHF